MPKAAEYHVLSGELEFLFAMLFEIIEKPITYITIPFVPCIVKRDLNILFAHTESKHY